MRDSGSSEASSKRGLAESQDNSNHWLAASQDNLSGRVDCHPLVGCGGAGQTFCAQPIVMELLTTTSFWLVVKGAEMMHMKTIL
jgi:hypothetical protein